MTIEMATAEDLKCLTGLVRPHAIKRYLDEEGIPYMKGADGWPRVLQAVLLERLGGKQGTPTREPQLRLRNG
jgi:hypothetical protein